MTPLKEAGHPNFTLFFFLDTMTHSRAVFLIYLRCNMAWVWAGEKFSVNTLSGGSLVLGALIANEVARIFRERKSKAHILRDVEKVESEPMRKNLFNISGIGIRCSNPVILQLNLF